MLITCELVYIAEIGMALDEIEKNKDRNRHRDKNLFYIYYILYNIYFMYLYTGKRRFI